MSVPYSASWTPRDAAELAAAWRLWLELNMRLWPDSTWNGSPADAVRPLRTLIDVCGAIQDECTRGLAAGQRPPELVRLLGSLIFVASFPLELWADDTEPLCADRAALLHADLSSVAEHVAGIRALLARGGGWPSVEAARTPLGPSPE